MTILATTQPKSHPPARLAWTIWGLAALLYLIAFYQRVAPAVFTDKLMMEFSIGAAALGNLSAFYFYAYVAMQIPTGVIADRWGPRRLLTCGAALAALGSLVFAMAPSMAWANAGRLLIGGSVAVAFVSMLKLATHWFTPRQFTLASGMALFVGVVGGVFAGVPLRLLVDAFGWREVMAAAGLVSAALALAIWRIVRNDPAELGYASHLQHQAGAASRFSVWRGIKAVLSYRNTWLLFVTPGGLAGAVLAFAGLWGVPYLTQVHHLSHGQAASITSALLVAWAVGGPAMGTLSERLGHRKPLYIGCCAVAVLGWAALTFMPTPSVPALIALLLVVGFVSGAIIIGFAYAKESVPAHLGGTASGVVNMGTMTGPMVLQPAVGWMLDRAWDGAIMNGVRVYGEAAYRAGFGLILVWVVLSLLMVSMSRETHCRQMP
jgi:MFS family permease